MQPSRSQKILRIISIISLVGGVLSLLMGVIFIFGGGYYAAEGPAVEGMTAVEAGAAFAGVGISTVVEGIIALIQGALGLRAVKDNSKIMPVWVLAVLGLVGGVASIVMTMVAGADASQLGSAMGGLVGSGVMFWLANTIKKEAGK